MMKQHLSITVLLILILQGCAAPVPDSSSSRESTAKDNIPGTESQAEKPPAGKADDKITSKTKTLPAPKQLDSELLYHLMAAEVAGQRGQLGVASRHYLLAARQSKDAAIAERATRIAVYARDNQRALEAARLWSKLKPDSHEANQVMAALLVRTGKTDEAQTYLEKLISSQNDQKGFMLISSMLSKEGDKKAALSAMQKLVARHEGNAEAVYALAHLAYLVNSLDIAEKNITEAVRLKPDWTEAHLLHASVLGRLNKHKQVISNLEKAVKNKPADVNLRVYLARKYIDLKNMGKARQHFLTVLDYDPEHADSLFALGLITLQMKKLDEAENYFLRLIELNERKNEARYYLGQIAETREQLDKAKKWYLLVEEGNNYLDAQIRVATLMAKQGDVAAAREHLQNIPADNASMEVRLYLAEGEILRDANQYEEAVKLYSEGLENLQDNIQLLYARALTAEKMDNLRQTILDLTRIVEIEPGHTQALNALGYTLVDQTQRIEEGFRYIQKAYKKEPNDAAIQDSMGWALYRLGKPKEALSYLRKAFEDTHDAEIAAHLGEVLWVMGKESEAMKIWQDALRQTPDHQTLKNVIERFTE